MPIGLTVICSGTSATGFNGTGQDGFTVTVQPGATVSNPGLNVIALDNNNVVTNFGSILVDANLTGITAGTGNQVTNAGTITGGDTSAGIVMLTGTVTNSGTITLGASGAIGISASTVTNTGNIVVGDSSNGILGVTNGGMLSNSGTITTSGFGIGINLNNNVDSVSILNTGRISVGDDGVGIGGDNNNNNLSIVNSGTITFGGCGTGISAGGTGNTILNSGTLAVATCNSGGGGGTGINAGDSNSVTNTGVISVGDGGTGIQGGTGTTIVNNGRIVAGIEGFGIVASGNVTNNGTIIVGDGIPATLGAGIAGLADNATFINNGTIAGGAGAMGIFLGSGSDNVLVNNGRITVGDDGIGMLATGGDRNALTNNGTIIVGNSSGGQSAGMFGDGDNHTLTNRGTIIIGSDAAGMATSGRNGVLINSGTIIGSDFSLGMIALDRDSTLVNSGTIIVGADGIGIGVQGRNASISNSGTIVVGDCGVGIDSSPTRNATIVNTGRIIGTGCAAKGVSLGLNDTLINSGLISAPLSVRSSDTVTVSNTGTLDGTIDVGGPNSLLTNAGLITVSGPLVAGSSAQHFIDGTFTQMRAGTLALRLLPDSSSTGNYDTLQVTGVANLGGTLKPIAQPGLYGPSTTYVGVLTFASSTGRFDAVAPASLFLAASAVYNPDSVDLVLTRLPFNSVFGGGSANTRAIGNVLEANYSTSLTGTLATFYSNLLLSTSPNTLAQLTGEVATAPQSAAFGVFSQFLGTVFGQTATSRAAGQAAAGGGEPMSLARSTTPGGGMRTAFAFAQDCSSDYCDTSPRRVTAWAQGFGGVGSVDGNATTGASRVDLNAAGGALGVDMQVTPSLIAGVTMGTTAAGFGLSDIASSGSSRSIVLGVYGGYTQGPLYVDAALAYAYNSFNTTRSINTGSMSEVAYGAFDGHQYGGRVEGGWRFAIDRHAVTPFAGMTVQALSQSGYSETSRDTTTGNPGLLGVTVQGQTATSVRSILGLQFETTIGAADSAIVKPRVRLGWAHEFNPNRSATVALSVLPGAPFQVAGAQPNADSLVVGAGLELELGRMVRIFGQFDGDFAGNARGLSGTGGVRLVW